MKTLWLLAFLFAHTQIFSQSINESYTADPASTEKTGVPKGEVLKFTFNGSKIFPGTSRDYWVYVPVQYNPDSAACVYVNQDGIQWKAPVVFDNLIHQKEMPVTIGVFINPGRVKSANGQDASDRFNRSYEYDGLGDNYVRFLLEELLPEVEKQKTSNGRVIRLSKKGNDRAIGGSSSGAVCAFTAAWEKPEEFSRVFSAIGTYVGLRGADHYSTLVRKYEPKPIRVFMQDGSNDLNIYAGDWWKANESMQRALTFSGYEVKHVWGEGAHNGQHGTAIFPEAMRWLWKGWPQQVKPGASKNQVLADILIPGQNWELVGEGYKFTEGTAADEKGRMFFQDIPNSKTYSIDEKGNPVPLTLNSKRAAGTSYGADGNRYVAATETKQVISYDINGKEKLIADSVAGNDLVVAQNGNIYVTSPNGSDKPGNIILIRTNGQKLVVDAGLKFPNGIAITPDQSQLYVTESTSHWVWIYSILPDGTLTNRQRYGWLHEPDTRENAWADGLKCDTAGRVYVTGWLGVQVLDQLGRVNAILPLPSGQASNCAFGGPDFNILYVTCGDRVYRRKLKTRGANSFDKPLRPAAARL
ncbi:MAG: gluconolactonase [Chitinophagaceae bacterium]|nr:MAG: gluconolactonase [Chitinophagaceae bacterium]